MVVLCPFDSKFKKGNFITKCILCSLLVHLILAGSFTVYLVQTLNKLPFGLCLPFMDPTDSLISFKILTWLVSIVQICTAISIIIIYSHLVLTLGKSEANLCKAQLHSKVNKSLVLQLIIVSLSNILCWLPSCSIFVSSQFMSRYPIKMLIWTTVTMMPINSIINPIVFCFNTFRKLQK